MFTANKIIKQLEKVPYASSYNFQPWTSVKKNIDIKSSRQSPYKLLMKLRKEGLVKQVPIYPERIRGRLRMEEMFFTVKELKPTHISQRGTYNDQIARSMVEHQSGLMDIFLAFINLYPDCTVEIDYKKEFSYIKRTKSDIGFNTQNKNYCPDAFIKLTTIDQREYDFIIEFERTKSHDQIRKDKFRLCNSINKFGTYGLSRHTKFLFFYTYDNYDVFARPIQYGNEEIKKHQRAVEYRLNSLIEKSQEHLNLTYLFLPFHDFYRLDKCVWKTSQNKLVPLVH